MWIHREQDDLWWTISANSPVQISKEAFSDRRRKHEELFIYYKATTGWSNKNKAGRLLKWRALHPKATHFLATEGTLQELSPDNAEYARALIDGVDLAQWHSRSDWKAREHDTGRGAVTIFNARLRAVVRMAKTAFETAEHANGQQVLRTLKDKRCEFTTPKQLEDYLDTLILEQDSVCAITQLALQFDGETEDLEMLASLDRIDSDGHYAMGNLQVVCRFINRWKNSSNDAEFRRLIALLQGGLPD